MKWLEKKRDEMARLVQDEVDEEFGSSAMELEYDAFVKGFDAAVKELGPIIEYLISDMQYMAADDIDIADVPSEVRSYILRARAALKKYKTNTEGE